jgi:hypothetical protein
LCVSYAETIRIFALFTEKSRSKNRVVLGRDIWTGIDSSVNKKRKGKLDPLKGWIRIVFFAIQEFSRFTELMLTPLRCFPAGERSRFVLALAILTTIASVPADLRAAFVAFFGLVAMRLLKSG